jgi:membrane protein implicated in regulation of membrane protease activity
MIEDILKSDIFFFITSVSIIAVTSLIIVVLIYVAEILHDIRHVSKNVRKGSDHLTESLMVVMEDFKKGGKRVAKKISSFIPKPKSKTRSKT